MIAVHPISSWSRHPAPAQQRIVVAHRAGSRFAGRRAAAALVGEREEPNAGTTEAFKRPMLAAKSVAHSRTGASGLYAATLMQRLGIADELKSRTVKFMTSPQAARVVHKSGIEPPVALRRPATRRDHPGCSPDL